jgi:ribosomal protein L20
LVAAKIEVDRKVLADLAVTDEATFKAIFDKAIAALDRKNAA